MTTAPSYLIVHLKTLQHDDSESGKIETALPKEGEVAGNPSSNPEADCAFIKPSCKDFLENRVYANQYFKSLQADYEDNWPSPSMR